MDNLPPIVSRHVAPAAATVPPTSAKKSTVRIVLQPLGVAALLIALTSLAVISVLNYYRYHGMLSAKEESENVLIPAFSAVSWRLNNEQSDASLSVQPDPNAPGINNSVLHAVVRKGDSYHPYSVRASKPVPQVIPKNHPLHLSFWGKSKSSSNATVVFEMGHPPYTKDLDRPVTLTPKWKEYHFDFTSGRDYAMNEGQVRLILGKSTGEFDFSGLELRDDSTNGQN